MFANLLKVLRYGDSKRVFGAITHKMPSSQLKELETDVLAYLIAYRVVLRP